MTLHTLLASLSDRGIRLSAQDGSLVIDAPKGSLTPELRAVLADHKTHLLNLLQQEASTVPQELPELVPAPEDRHQPFPLTDMQHAFWVGRSGVLQLGHVSNHGYYEIEGQDLDVDRLNATLQQLIQRHDMLRAVVWPTGQQQILPEVPPYEMARLDLRGQPESVVATQLDQVRQTLSHQVLPADRWPLYDFRVTYLEGGRVRLHVSFDLLIFDAWSLFRLFEEWFQLYQQPEALLPPLEISFRDYVLAEQQLLDSPLYEQSREYWLQRIESLPPAPELPLAKNPQAIQQHQCRRYSTQVPPEVWQALKHRAAQAGLTPSGLLLSAFAEIIARWSKSPQFTLNLALFNRLPLHPQVNNLLGDFTSVTLLAVDNAADQQFCDRALRLQTQLWRDLEHRHFSGVRVTREITRRQGGIPTAMPVVFTSTLGFATMGQELLTFSHFGDLVYGISQASQAWMDVQVWEEKESLFFNWDVVEELFPEGMIAAMFAAYRQLLQQLGTEPTAWQMPRPLDLPSDQRLQRQRVNATAAPISEALLHELFLTQAQCQPDHPAVIVPERTLTYGELAQRATGLAQYLRTLGAQPNQLIGIVMTKGWEQVVAVLGILIAGAAYVPIDPSLPPERLQYLLSQSEIQVVVTQADLGAHLPWPASIHCVCVQGEEEPPVWNGADLPLIQTPDDLAYVIYTSGSTGLPKGVMISHRSVVNVVVYTNQRFQVSNCDRMLALTALNHDLSVYDLFGLLSAGGTLVMPEAARGKDPTHWADLIQQHQVTLWNSVPAMMDMLVTSIEPSSGQQSAGEAARSPSPSPSLGQASAPLLTSLRLAILGGDWLPVTLPDRIRALVPDIHLLSIGGPTETTIWNIGYAIDQVDPTWKSIPYGTPMANSRYYILNATLEDCPVWVPGQLYCAGVQVAQGYWRDATKTADHFITHPQTGERLYRTGDLGRYWPDGTIEFLGRVDFQLKLRGYRIEAGEIEAALLQHPMIQAAVVTCVGTGQQAQLVAYAVPQGDSAPSVEDLRAKLRAQLPDYMVPSVFVLLAALPLSANGKVDRKALPAPETAATTPTPDTLPQTELESAIAAVFQRVLEQESVGVNDNFFDLGANSLLITTIYRELITVLPSGLQPLTLVDLFSRPTIRLLAQHLAQSQPDDQAEVAQQAVTQTLTQGKQRLKQRFNQSRLAHR